MAGYKIVKLCGSEFHIVGSRGNWAVLCAKKRGVDHQDVVPISYRQPTLAAAQAYCSWKARQWRNEELAR